MRSRKGLCPRMSYRTRFLQTSFATTPASMVWSPMQLRKVAYSSVDTSLKHDLYGGWRDPVMTNVTRSAIHRQRPSSATVCQAMSNVQMMFHAFLHALRLLRIFCLPFCLGSQSLPPNETKLRSPYILGLSEDISDNAGGICHTSNGGVDSCGNCAALWIWNEHHPCLST